MFIVYVPSNSGLQRFNELVTRYVAQPVFSKVRGERIPEIVAERGGYGWTGNDLYQDFCARYPRNPVQCVRFLPWPEPMAPRLCLVGRVENTLEDYREGLRTGFARIAIPDKYQNMVEEYLEVKSWRPQCLVLSGQVEKQIRRGRAELAFDIVYSGRTLRDEGLKIYDTVFDKSGFVLLTLLTKNI